MVDVRVSTKCTSPPSATLAPAWQIASADTPRRSQISSVALSTAFVLFPLWCFLCGLCVWLYTGSFGWGLGFIAMMIASGYFTSRYFNHFALFVFQVIWPARKTPVEILREMRDELILVIDEMLAKV